MSQLQSSPRENRKHWLERDAGRDLSKDKDFYRYVKSLSDGSSIPDRLLDERITSMTLDCLDRRPESPWSLKFQFKDGIRGDELGTGSRSALGTPFMSAMITAYYNTASNQGQTFGLKLELLPGKVPKQGPPYVYAFDAKRHSSVRDALEIIRAYRLQHFGASLVNDRLLYRELFVHIIFVLHMDGFLTGSAQEAYEADNIKAADMSSVIKTIRNPPKMKNNTKSTSAPEMFRVGTIGIAIPRPTMSVYESLKKDRINGVKQAAANGLGCSDDKRSFDGGGKHTTRHNHSLKGEGIEKGRGPGIAVRCKLYNDCDRIQKKAASQRNVTKREQEILGTVHGHQRRSAQRSLANL
ncbi:hypothetical protein F5Y15DRAFT_425322 [Xylariaceae sp. FL0016]|nr:hypothetical protein F5Y15DRAFT_425322 [Xylariaceae sp. FL0016]